MPWINIYIIALLCKITKTLHNSKAFGSFSSQNFIFGASKKTCCSVILYKHILLSLRCVFHLQLCCLVSVFVNVIVQSKAVPSLSLPDESCQGTVPESIIAFLESTDYESAIRLTISLGGDADTMGAITGGIAEAYYGGIPEHIKAEVVKRLPDEFFHVMSEFYKRFVEKAING